MEFEGDDVDDEACHLKPFHTTIWWSYGGDRILASEPDAERIQATAKQLLRDASFEDFIEHMRTRRKLRPDGQVCNSRRECAFYDVVATFTGRFFAGKKRPDGTLGGFGHRGCCHLFVLEQISDVASNRTDVPSDDQQFSCGRETWQGEFPPIVTSHLSLPEAASIRIAANKKFLSDQIRLHDGSLFDAAVDYRSPQSYLGLTGRVTWSSPDLLTTYFVQFPWVPPSKRNSKHQSLPDSPIPVSVVRERCEPIAH